MPRKKKPKVGWFIAEKCIKKISNFGGTNDVEVCNEAHIDEVDIEAGSSRDLPIEVLPNNINGS